MRVWRQRPLHALRGHRRGAPAVRAAAPLPPRARSRVQNRRGPGRRARSGTTGSPAKRSQSTRARHARHRQCRRTSNVERLGRPLAWHGRHRHDFDYVMRLGEPLPVGKFVLGGAIFGVYVPARRAGTRGASSASCTYWQRAAMTSRYGRATSPARRSALARPSRRRASRDDCRGCRASTATASRPTSSKSTLSWVCASEHVASPPCPPSEARVPSPVPARRSSPPALRRCTCFLSENPVAGPAEGSDVPPGGVA